MFKGYKCSKGVKIKKKYKNKEREIITIKQRSTMKMFKKQQTVPKSSPSENQNNPMRALANKVETKRKIPQTTDN